MYSFLCVRIHNFSMYTKSKIILDGELNIVYLQAHPKSSHTVAQSIRVFVSHAKGKMFESRPQET